VRPRAAPARPPAKAFSRISRSFAERDRNNAADSEFGRGHGGWLQLTCRSSERGPFRGHCSRRRASTGHGPRQWQAPPGISRNALTLAMMATTLGVGGCQEPCAVACRGAGAFDPFPCAFGLLASSTHGCTRCFPPSSTPAGHAATPPVSRAQRKEFQCVPFRLNPFRPPRSCFRPLPWTTLAWVCSLCSPVRQNTLLKQYLPKWTEWNGAVVVTVTNACNVAIKAWIQPDSSQTWALEVGEHPTPQQRVQTHSWGFEYAGDDRWQFEKLLPDPMLVVDCGCAGIGLLPPGPRPGSRPRSWRGEGAGVQRRLRASEPPLRISPGGSAGARSGGSQTLEARCHDRYDRHR